jgi:hypothetical protein
MRARTKVTVAAVVVLGFAGYGSGHAASLPARPGRVTVTTASVSGTLDCSQLETLWEAAGGSPSAAFTAAEIATAESSGRENATLVDGNGTTDRGYWQVNSVHGSLSTYDPMGNARAAVEISDDGTNWSPWTTYRTGAYAGQC